jgi:flavin-dependent dehydrogenase
VIVVGAGPAGSAAACYLARSGLDVLLLEKATFPREKVCGDGLTPRAVKALVGMGVPIGEEDGWLRNKGLRVIGGGFRLELPWPELSSYPGYGLVRSRLDFDETLARAAQRAGARLLEGVTVTGPVLDRTGRMAGVTARGAGRHLPGAGRGGRGRELLPAVPGHGPAQAGRPAAGGGGADLLHQPAARG